MLTFDLFQIFHMECFANTNYWDKLWVATLIPLGMLVTSFLVQFLLVRVGFAKVFWRGVTVKVVLIIVYLALPMISNIICQAFACQEFYDPSAPDGKQFPSFMKVSEGYLHAPRSFRPARSATAALTNLRSYPG